ncbi:MAG: endonuclease domain-containing protein [Fimbriiglobus sp.]
MPGSGSAGNESSPGSSPTATAPATGLVVEIDGHVHREKIEADIERDRILAGHGLEILRLTNDEVFADPTAVVRVITESVLECAASPAIGAGGWRIPS